MGVTNYGNLYYPEGDKNSVSTETLLMQESLRQKVVVHYASTGVRDTATAALVADIVSTGLICHVTNKGWYGYDGPTNTWTPFAMQGYTFNRGVAQGNCDINGIMQINHGLPVAPVTVMVTMEGDNPQIRYLSPVVVSIDSTKFLVKFWYNNPASPGALQVNAGAYTSFHWRAEV